jgi:uncharacterized protein YlzI (FlbEa/FlbD family)
VIAVTCRNGEHFSVDPRSIERVETDHDTVIHLVDGTKFVVAESFDRLLRSIQDHRAAFVTASHQLTRTTTGSLPPTGGRHSRHARGDHPVVVLPGSVED